MKTTDGKLFPLLTAEARAALAALPDALDAALPLRAAHRRDLPAAVRELSMRLTCERGGNRRPYWAEPRLASAYLRYFLPWNLMRLIRLVSGLDLPSPPTDAPERPMLLDIGSGPLTVPLAMWLAKPEWRGLPLDLICLDNSSRALDLGCAIFARLAGEKTPWRIIPVRADMNAAGREARGRPWLICCANALNEMKTGHGPLYARPLAFAEQAARLLRPQGALLCVEPGSRLGGMLVQELRNHALALGFTSARPCPHTRPCPLRGARSWCHFSLDTRGAPDWLTRLAHEARLPKKSLHLSFALLRRRPSQPHDAAHEEKTEYLETRVISAPFRVAGSEKLARYACSARGLLLLTQAADAPSGALVGVKWPASPERDAHSGAWIL